MSQKKKSNAAPNETKVHYCFNLRDIHDWHGEIIYSVESLPAPGIFDGGLLSLSMINIVAEVSSTTSKKLKAGAIIAINVYINDGIPVDNIGYITKIGKTTTFVVRLPWSMANHLHMILMSNKDLEMSIMGTELYRGSGLIHSLHVTKDSVTG